MEACSYRGKNGDKIFEIFKNPMHVATIKGNVNAKVAQKYYREKVNDEENGHTPLHLAVIKGNNSLAAKIISFGGNLSKLNKYGYAPLHLAVLADRISLIETLINADITNNVDIFDVNGDTALHISALRGNANAAHALLIEGANADLPNREGDTALHLAIIQGNSEVLDVLVKYVRKPNLFDKNKFRPLHLAVLFNRIDAIPKLGKLKGTNVNSLNGDGDSALHVATKLRNLEAIDALLNLKINVNRKNAKGYSSMHLAVKASKMSTSDILARFGGAYRYRNKPIHVAEAQKIVNTLKVLCRPDQNVNVNIKNRSGKSILISLIMADCEDSVKLLLDLGAKVNCHNTTCKYFGMTSLHIAVCLGNKGIIEALLRHGANARCLDSCGDMPIHAAAKFCSAVGIEILAEHGGDINLKNRCLSTPLDITMLYVKEDAFEIAVQTLTTLYKAYSLKKKTSVSSDEILKCAELIIKLDIWKNFQSSKLNDPEYNPNVIPTIKNYITDCFDEIGLMKSTFLRKDFDLYEFARNGWYITMPMPRYYASKVALNYILDVSKTKGYPIYRDIMASNLDRSALINKVLCLRLPVMHNGEKIFLDLEAVNRYLGNVDILNLLLAYPEFLDTAPSASRSGIVKKRKLAES